MMQNLYAASGLHIAMYVVIPVQDHVTTALVLHDCLWYFGGQYEITSSQSKVSGKELQK